MRSPPPADRTTPDGDTHEALIFDWDGTLVDSRNLNHRALESALRDCGVTLPRDWYWQQEHVAFPLVLAEWETTAGPLPEPIETIVDRCHTYVVAGAPTLEVISDTVEVARRAHARQQPLAVGSNCAAISLEAGMKATGLASLFQTVVNGSDVPRSRYKPAPDIFLLAAERLGIDPRRCLVYEDSAEGIAAALAAGMDAYNVRTREFHSAWPRTTNDQG